MYFVKEIIHLYFKVCLPLLIFLFSLLLNKDRICTRMQSSNGCPKLVELIICFKIFSNEKNIYIILHNILLQRIEKKKKESERVAAFSKFFFFFHPSSMVQVPQIGFSCLSAFIGGIGIKEQIHQPKVYESHHGKFCTDLLD